MSSIDFGLTFFERSKGEIKFSRHSLNTSAKPFALVALGMLNNGQEIKVNRLWFKLRTLT